MDVRRAQIVVMMEDVVAVVIMPIVVMVMAVMMMPATKQKGARDIHEQADDGDARRLRERDRPRLEEPCDGFHTDAERYQGQDQSRREAGQVTDLAGAEGESAVAGIAPG